MRLMDESMLQKQQRLDVLKQKAQKVLEHSAPDATHDPLANPQTLRLLEDLRIYQVELELQNEELRAAQQAAEIARKRYQTLFAQMPLAAIVVDAKGIIDDSNERADALLGRRKPMTNLDSRLWTQITRDDRTRLHVALRDAMLGQAQVLSQLALDTPEGTQNRVFDAHLIGLSIDYKLDRRVLMLLVDRTAELARQQDQHFYSLLLDSSDAFIYAFDKDGKALLANQALLDFVGHSREEVLSQRREVFLPLRDAILHTEADQRVLQTGQTLTLEEQVHMPAPRKVRDFITRKFPLLDLSGRVYGVGGISTDVTLLKEQQRQTLLSETVFVNSADAIIITDADTRIIRVNPAFTRHTGFSESVVVGRKTSLLKSGRQDAAFYQAMWQALGHDGSWSGEINNRRADGSYYTVMSNINAVCDAAGTVLHYIAVQTDVTLLYQAQLRLAHQASYDSLTGLPNRSLFNDRITQMMSAAQRHQRVFALLFIDLDRFKEVNDTLGHSVGDQLLRVVAKRLQEAVRVEDTVARIGGDEFVVLLPGTDRNNAQSVASNLLAKLHEPVSLAKTLQYRPMASMGMAMFPEDGGAPDLLLRNADIAMYGAKVGGRNRMSTYTPNMSQAADHAFAIQTELEHAIGQHQLRVYYQPKCRLDTGELMGAEALVRWERTGHGLVLPGEFIGIAEKTGQLAALDQWVIAEALRQVGLWRGSGRWQDNWRVAVNQNAADLQRPDMTQLLQQHLQQHHVSAQSLELEITEDALLLQTPAQLARLAELSSMGVTLAIDDFGTGYSSLAYLRQLPVSVIKIDQSFIGSMLTNDKDAVLVRTIVDLAHNLGHTLVAEGVELSEQRLHLAQLGCELGQGYLFGKPVSADEFADQWL